MHVSRTALALFLGSWAHPAVAQEAALQTVATKLVGSQVIPGSMFGEAIDVDGDQMAIGAPDHYSYGRRHDGSERAPGISACLPQSSSSCE